MFDWNDEELANIIWGEAADSDDHIVPYPEASENYYDKKEWNQGTVHTKPMEQKSAGTTNVDDTHGRKLESNPVNEEGTSALNLSNDRLAADSSLSKPCRIDQDSLGTEVSHELTENRKYNSPRHAVTIKDAENFHSTQEGKEQADFVDYGWASIGSFDDLDRIFSNDDPIFGQVCLSDADELWSSSSKDMRNSPMKLFPTVDSQNLESGVDTHENENPEYLKQNEQLSTLSGGGINDAGLLGLQLGSSILTDVEGDMSRAIAKDQTDLEKMSKPATAILHQRTDNIAKSNEFSLNKIGRQKKLFKSRRKAEGKSEEMFRDFCGNWPSSTNPAGQFDNSLAPQLVKSPPSIITEHMQLQGVESLQYQRTFHPLMHPSFYTIAANSYPTVPLLSQIQPGDLPHQPLLGHDISLGGANRVDKPADGFVKSLTMTPQEKIEKLRRRQQMQAMLAIQKQQLQFNNQVATTSQSISPKCPQEIQSQLIEKGDLDSDEIYTLPSVDPKSPLEQDDSNTASTAVDRCSMEESILCRLQEIISKLDFKIRLCIRDSLFRLAQSAMQRHYATNDTSSSNKSTRDEHDITAKGEINSHCGIAGVPDAETETNPIDRTVAHLLFHRPFELLQNCPDAPESPISNKLSFEPKAGSKSSPMEFLQDSTPGKRHIPQDGTKNSWMSAETQQIKTSPCMDSSDNTSNPGLVDDAVLEYEGSQ